MGPGCGIQEGSLDHKVVSLGVCFRFSESNIGKEASVTATDVIALGPPNGTIFHGLEPGSIAHLLMAPSLFGVWHHTLQLSIGSHKVKYLLLPIQVVGTIGIQVHIEISHKYRGMSMGRILIESKLYMVVEIIQSFLFGEKVGTNNRDLANSGTVQATDAVVAMSLNIFHMKGRLFASISGIIDSDCDATLVAGVCFGSIDIVSSEVSQVNNAFRVGISLLPSEAGTGEDDKANSKGFEV